MLNKSQVMGMIKGALGGTGAGGAANLTWDDLGRGEVETPIWSLTAEFISAGSQSFTNAEKEWVSVTAGQTYRVTYDGEKYDIVAKFSGGQYLGDPKLEQASPEGLEYPFLIRFNRDKVTVQVLTTTPGMHTLTIATVGEGIIPIPEEYLPEGVGSGSNIPITTEANKMLVTDDTGTATWDERPYYKTVKKVHINEATGEDVFPITVTTAASGGYNSAQDERLFLVALFSENPVEIIFDGASYMCEPKLLDGFAYFGATMNPDWTASFEDYPFVLCGPALSTKEPGSHSLDVFVSSVSVTVNYGPALKVEVQREDDRKYLLMDDVAKIEKAWKNNITIVLSTSSHNLAMCMLVSEVSPGNYIRASASMEEGGYGGVATYTQTFSCSTGELSREGFAVHGTISENANSKPLLYINNKWYKVDLDSSGMLKATQYTG